MNIPISTELFEKSKGFIPGGVNSPVRAFQSVGGVPRFIKRGSGAYLWDVDGHRYIDYVLSWGPLILGHAPEQVVSVLKQTIENGTSFGAPTLLEYELAQRVIETIPSIEMIRFVNSGTEATMSVIRLARAYTGRDKIVKFAGNYHGHVDSLLVQAGSGVATLGLPDSPGVPALATADTLLAPYNNLDAVKELFYTYDSQIAAIIVEPVAANMGFVMPEKGFLHGLQELCHQHGALFILDEVMTGFRVAPGGAQTAWNLDPDLTTLGKVIGGGLPVGAYGGKSKIMKYVAPVGPMYQAGTLSGNPLAMAAGLTTLNLLFEKGVFEGIANKTQKLIEGLRQVSSSTGIPIQADYAGTLFGFYFLKNPNRRIDDYASAKANADTEQYARFFHAMLGHGVYFAPSQFEAGFMSNAHSDQDINNTIDIIAQVFMNELRPYSE